MESTGNARDERSDRQRAVALLQTSYYLPTAIWPLVGIKSFEKLTGPKTDDWLVQTVGVLVGVIGGTIGTAGVRRRVTPEIEGLAVGTALSLAAADVLFVSRGRVGRIYLLDALANCAITAGWLWARRPLGRS